MTAFEKWYKDNGDWDCGYVQEQAWKAALEWVLKKTALSGKSIEDIIIEELEQQHKFA